MPVIWVPMNVDDDESSQMSGLRVKETVTRQTRLLKTVNIVKRRI